MQCRGHNEKLLTIAIVHLSVLSTPTSTPVGTALTGLAIAISERSIAVVEVGIVLGITEAGKERECRVRAGIDTVVGRTATAKLIIDVGERVMIILS